MAGGTDSAEFVSQTFFTYMIAGQNYDVTVTMKNNGTTVWSPETCSLGSQNPDDHTNWGTNIWTRAARYRLGPVNPVDSRTWKTVRAVLPGEVAPDGTVTFTFAIQAPATPGQYNFQWTMLQEVVGRFGSPSPNLELPVVAP